MPRQARLDAPGDLRHIMGRQPVSLRKWKGINRLCNVGNNVPIGTAIFSIKRKNRLKGLIYRIHIIGFQLAPHLRQS